MTLREHFEGSGKWLFRRRSFLPLLLAPAFYLALRGFRYPANSHGWDLAWEALCLGIALLGVAVRALTVSFAAPGTSGRNRHAQVAESLNTTGMYSLVRHPLYLGNYLQWLGVALFPRVWWLPLIVTLVFWIYYERIMFAEEAFLRSQFGAAFDEWASRTPAIVPWRLQWRPPELRFCLRRVLRCEYSGLWAVVTAFAVLEGAGDWVVSGRLTIDPVWGALWLGATALAAALRALKHYTDQLTDPVTG